MNAKYSEAIFKLGWLVTSQPKLTFLTTHLMMKQESCQICRPINTIEQYLASHAISGQGTRVRENMIAGNTHCEREYGLQGHDI